MFWWLPAQASRELGVDPACLRRKAGGASSHDLLYHSVLGLLEVRTPRYQAGRDLFHGCRASQLAQAPGSHRSMARAVPAIKISDPLNSSLN